MKQSFLIFILFLTVIILPGQAQTESFSYGPFGTVHVYRESSPPSRVILFVSGDGGWNLGVVTMAKALAALDSLVIGIDITHYLKATEGATGTCSYPAADFEQLSKFIQKKYGFDRYRIPILIGYSSGATLVYAALVQAPANTFQGAISLGFCPDWMSAKPLCKGSGLEWEPGPKGKGYIFRSAYNLRAPWIALQGTIDQVCDSKVTQIYVEKIKGAEIVLLPKVGHGFSVEKNWLPQFKEAYLRLTAKKESPGSFPVQPLPDLPLVEVRSKASENDFLIVMLSGDGGWAGIDRELADVLSQKGFSVVGLNSLQYFWTARTPDGSAKDLERILNHYLTAWKKSKTVLIGYSQGADVLPFMASRLPRPLFDQVDLIVLLGPSQRADFEFHLTQWLPGVNSDQSMLVAPELEKIKGKKILCFCGDRETDTLCKQPVKDLMKVFILKGAHHFGGDYGAIAEAIINELENSKQD